MKHVSQAIALSFFGLIAVQALLVIAPVIILVQLFLKRIAKDKRTWEIKKGRKSIENNMWAIE